MKIRFGLYAFIVLFVLAACETEVTLDLPEGEKEIVVDGRIETGEGAFVTLTQTASFYGNISLSPENIDDFFVRGATVTVSDGENTIELTEFDLAELGFGAGVVYLDPLGDLPGENGKTYNLRVETEDGRILTSSTAIPNTLPIDSIWWKPQTIGDNDSLATVFVELSDPDTLGNFYRYFTQRNDEEMLPGLASVFDDLVVNGKTFPSPLDRAESRVDSINFEYYGFFNLGDEVTIKWCGIDNDVYDFWRTLEANTQAGGPFSGITVVKGNVEGALGVWSGYGVQEAFISIPNE